MSESSSAEYAKDHPIANKVRKGTAAVAAAATFAAGGLSSPVAPDFRGPVYSTTQSTVQEQGGASFTREVPEIYARLFSKDPEAGKLVNPEDVAKEFTDIQTFLSTLTKAGYKITGEEIDTIGVASDDDDTTVNGIRTGGLEVHNEKDRKLGKKRGTTYDRLLAEVYKEHGMTPPTIQPAIGAEAVLGENLTEGLITYMNLDTKEIQADIKYLQKVAKQKNMTLGNLLDDLNGIGSEAPPASEKLHEVFKKLFIDKRETIVTFNVTDEIGHIVKAQHKTFAPAGWFLPEAYLTEEYAPKQPQQENGRPPKEKGKVNRGFAKPVERIVQPRRHNYNALNPNYTNKKRYGASENRGGRGAPTNVRPYKGGRKGL